MKHIFYFIPVILSPSPPVDIIWTIYDKSKGYDVRLSELFCAVLCKCMTVVHINMHTWAVRKQSVGLGLVFVSLFGFSILWFAVLA